MKNDTLKKALALLAAVVTSVWMILPGAVPAFAAGGEAGDVIRVADEAALAAALDRDAPVAEIVIEGDFTIRSDCTVQFDPAHINNYCNTVVTVPAGVTLTVGNGGMLGSFWPSFEGDWDTPPTPNGRVINNGTVIVEAGGCTGADFDTNNGEILVKAGGEAVCCNVNNGTVTVEAGGAYNTTQGGKAVNHGLIEIREGAVMTSRFGTVLVNEADGAIRLDGEFYCGVLGLEEDVMLFENYGELTGRGSVILYELDREHMPVADMDALIEKMMRLLGQDKRFENWDDIGIYRQVEAASYEELAAALTGERVVAEEPVPGDMDTIVIITKSMEIPENAIVDTMAKIVVPEGVTLTIRSGASVTCGMENRGAVEVMPGAALSTTMGGDIVNCGAMTVHEDAILTSQMGGSVRNRENAALTLDGILSVGCLGGENGDAFWFENGGAVTGKGETVLYEAAPDMMPVGDMDALVAALEALLVPAEGGEAPAAHAHAEHAWGEWERTAEPTETEDGEETRVCAICGAAETRPVKKEGAQAIDTDFAKERDGVLYLAPALTAADILALAGEGAEIVRADGARLQPEEAIGSGMILIRADGTRVTIIIKGDNDGDGLITAADARFALRIAVELETPSDWQLQASLVTGGDVVTAGDARAILRAAVGLEPLPLA